MTHRAIARTPVSYRLLAIVAGISITLVNIAAATMVTPGNLLVANGGIVYEYTPSGEYVHQVTGDLRNGVIGESRGLAYDHLERIHVLIRPHDGDDTMFLATHHENGANPVFNDLRAE